MRRTESFAVCYFFVCVMLAHAEPKTPVNMETGIEVSQITYKEPGYMSEKGMMYGINFSYSMLNDAQGKIDGKLSTGKMKYTGAYMDGTPVSMSGVNDIMLELRGLLGFLKSNTHYFQGPYVGLGFRYLQDGLDKFEGGYLRESNYAYIPLGYEYAFTPEAASSWLAGFVVEYDYFIIGSQKSHLSNLVAGLSDVVNEQNNGYGYRASLKFRSSAERVDLLVEPFIRYWKIAKSVPETITVGSQTMIAWEPANNSTEIGLKFIARY